MFLSSHLSWSLEIVWRISFCACLSRVWVVFFILTARLDKRWRFNEMGMRMRMRYWRLRELSISMDRLLGCRKIQQPITYKQCPKVRVPSMRPFIQFVRQPTSPLALRLRWSAASVCLFAMWPPVSTPFQSASPRRPQQLPAPHARQHLKRTWNIKKERITTVHISNEISLSILFKRYHPQTLFFLSYHYQVYNHVPALYAAFFPLTSPLFLKDGDHFSILVRLQSTDFFCFERDSADMAIIFIDYDGDDDHDDDIPCPPIPYNVSFKIYCNIITKGSQTPKNTTLNCIKKMFEELAGKGYLLAAI